VCELDAGIVGEDGKCDTCGRQVREPTPAMDFEAPPDMSPEQAEAQMAFRERYAAMQREREQQEAAAKKQAPEPSRWAKVVDTSGNVRW
jgi:hypothetical protein